MMNDEQVQDEPVKLTKREVEVLTLVIEGKSSKEVADLLFVSKRTVDFHLANIYDKLQVTKSSAGVPPSHSPRPDPFRYDDQRRLMLVKEGQARLKPLHYFMQGAAGNIRSAPCSVSSASR